MNIVSFSVGTALTWTSPMMDKLIKNGTDSPFDYTISDEEQSWISSSFNLGAAVAPFIFGNLVDRIGRKYTILGTGIPLLIGYLMMAFAKSVVCFYIARFLSGLGGGGVFNVVPVYIAEIADEHNRGIISSLLNIILCGGMLFTYILGPYVSVMVFNIVLAIFPCIFLVSFFLIGSESPYYYIKKGKCDKAQRVLQKFRGSASNVESEVNMIRKTIIEDGEGTFLDIFRSKALKKAFVITIGLMFFQQSSGIIAVLYYAQNIFSQAKVELDPAICSMIVGAVQFVATFTTPLFIEKLGRKKLLLLSAVGMFLSEAPLGVYSLLKDKNYDVSSVSVLPIICLIVYIVVYNLGFGPLPWTVMGELYPTKVKSAATVFATFTCWTLAFLVAKFFSTIVAGVGLGAAFLVFTSCCGISILFSYFFMIETKGKSLREVQDELAK